MIKITKIYLSSFNAKNPLTGSIEFSINEKGDKIELRLDEEASQKIVSECLGSLKRVSKELAEGMMKDLELNTSKKEN